MSNTENLDLRTRFLGLGPNAEAQLGENFKKIDEGVGKLQEGAGGGGQSGADVLLTGYTPEVAGAVAATDSVNAAIAKLEARIAALEP